MTALFIQKCLVFGPKLMRDFGWDIDGAAACLGNGGHESNGFAAMYEAGKRRGAGGVGGWQWTGPRARSFEAWCRVHGVGIQSDEGTYDYLAFELHGPESATVGAVKRAVGLTGKTRAFMTKFERPGILALSSRVRWAELAQTTLRHHAGIGPAPAPVHPIPPPKRSARAPMAKKATARHRRHA